MKLNINTRGISKRKNGNFEAYLEVKNTGKRSNTRFKAHIGTYKTKEEAEKARLEYILKLA